MKTNYRFFYVITLLLGLLLVGCDEEDEVPPEGDGTEQVGDGGGSDDGAADPMYFPPIGTGEWETKAAADIGWDTANLNEAIRYAKEKNSYNLLILHKGKIIVEEYWKGMNADSLHELNSVAKSMMAVVIGVLQSEGTLHLDDKVSTYLPAGWSLSPTTEADITLRHLLTMTSGLNDELEYIGRPGEIWRYSHEAYKVLYEVMVAATGKSYRGLFESILFNRLGMTKYAWSGRNISSSPREIARFGLMIMNKGVWNGERIIDDDVYFSDMLKTSQSLQQAYGYLWWLNGTETWYDDDTKTTFPGSIAPTMPADAWLAKGKHDQRIYIVPSLDLIVIRQGGYTALPESGEGSFDAELWKRIMDAVNAGAI